MKKFSVVLTMLSVVGLLAAGDLFGRGGGGRGGGGGGARGGGGFSGGGVSRPSSAASRSPSMGHAPSVSRPSTPSASRPSVSQPGAGLPRPSQPSAGARPGTGATPAAGARPSTGVASRPSAGQLQNFLDVKPGGAGPSTLPSTRPGNVAGAVAGGVAGGAAADFLRGGAGGARPGTLPAGGQRPAAGVGNRPGVADRSLAGNRPERIENRGERQQIRTDRRNEIRNQVEQNHPWANFWQDHPGWAAWRISRPWRWATWGALTGWVGGYGWSEPTAYSYGDNVYYEGDNVYYGEQAVATAEEYAQQAEAIAASAPEVAPDKAEWLPLGVFALTPDGQASGPEPSLFLQLAISKEGVIAGTLHNSATNSTQTIEGMADKATQRVAWNVKDKSRPIMETGISNLTQDSSPALVHFADGQTQQWLMVRLEDPEAKK